LKPGMFVHDFNCSWFTHPFMTNQLMIDNREMVDKVISHGIKELFIDTARGIDLGGETPPAKTGNPAKTVSRRKDETVVAEMPEEIATPGAPAIILDTFEENLARIKQRGIADEIPQALKVRERAQKLLENVFADIRSGKAIDIGPTHEVAEEMVKSAYRNSAAMACVAKLSDVGDGLLSHSINVCSLMVAFCRQVEMDAETTVEVATGALLHDVGMIKIDRNALENPDKMTPGEFQELKKHVVYSKEILSAVPGISSIALQVAELHHERYDGSGYPYGFKGDDIPQVAQMLCIVDIYDALTSKKVQKSGIKMTQGLKMLFEVASRGMLNPALVQTFIRCIGLYPIGTVVRLSNDKAGVVIRQNPESLLKPVVRIMYDLKKDCYIRPRDIDFATLPEGRENDKIVASMPSTKWNVDLIGYIH